MLPPTAKWMNFKKWVFVSKQAVSVFCETYPLIIVRAINSNSESIANGYVAPHLYMDEFQEIGFCILAGSICILCNIFVYSCLSRIHSQSLLKTLGGGQDKPAGIGCPPPPSPSSKVL